MKFNPLNPREKPAQACWGLFLQPVCNLYELRYMKNFSKICAFGFLFSTIFAASCKDSFVEPTKTPAFAGDPTEISMIANTVDHKTRAEVEADLLHTHWTAGDQVGLFTKFEERWSTASVYTVAEVDASDATKAAFTGKTKWQAAALPHYFYAYSPYKEGADDPKAIPVSLPDAQVQTGVGSDVVSSYNVMLAEPVQLTAPRNFTDDKEQKVVDLNMHGAFSIIEFRIASYQDALIKTEYATVQKVTLRTPKHPLAFTEGTLDITQADYSLDFARVKVEEGNMRYSSTLTINDAPKVPLSKKLHVVLGDQSSQVYNKNAVFPARMVVMPNMYDSSTTNIAPDDEWDVLVDYTVFGRNGDVNAAPEIYKDVAFRVGARRLRPGERHAIYVILPVKEGSGGVVVPEEPGEPWDGTTKTQPTIIETSKEVEIRTPGEFAWFADKVNSGDTDYNGFKDYTVKLMANINLGDHEWRPIGLDGVNTFKGHINGAGMGDRNGDGLVNATDGFLISGLSVTPEGDQGLTSDIANANFGLFGSLNGMEVTGSKMRVQNLRVKGKVDVPESTILTINDIGKSVRVGGFCGSATNVDFSNCKYEGDVAAYFLSAHQIGGIVGYSIGTTTITECHVNANIYLNSNIREYSSFASVGGIVGWSHGVVKGCSYSGTMTVTGSAGVGGIVGEAADGAHIKACANRGTINVVGYGNAIGGIVGILRATSVYACYNTGVLSCNDGVSQGGSAVGMGGIVGSMLSVSGQIRGCYNTAKLDVSKQYENQRIAGNIYGLSAHKSNQAYDFNRISYNYHLYPAMYSDSRSELKTNSIYKFSETNWPTDKLLMWGTGNGSADNRYWNAEHFPGYGGTGEWAYPRLYWEVIE